MKSNHAPFLKEGESITIIHSCFLIKKSMKIKRKLDKNSVAEIEFVPKIRFISREMKNLDEWKNRGRL